MNIAKATYCVRKVCTVLFVILLAFCLSWPLASIAKKRALLIGISHYPQTTRNNPCTWTNIHGSNDVRLLRGTLQKQGFRITTLTNAQATASHIRRALKRLCQQAAKGDMVVIHFSGHGQPFEDLSGDEADGWDEAIVPYDAKKCYSRTYTGRCHIIDDELERYINNLRTTVGPVVLCTWCSMPATWEEPVATKAKPTPRPVRAAPTWGSRPTAAHTYHASTAAATSRLKPHPEWLACAT